MGRVLTLLGGLGVGLGLMYVMDPDRGKKRRAVIRDRASRGAHEVRRFVEKTGRRIGDRTRDAWTEGKERISGRQLAAGILGVTAAAYAARVLVHRHRSRVRGRQ